jgi:glycosyltransferase involved in cell wall biosynthesis
MSLRPSAVHFSTVHNPSDVRIFHKQCVTLARSGWDVTLITSAKERGTTAEFQQNSGVTLRTIPASRGRVGRFSVTMLRMLRLLLQTPADCYHFHDPELIPVGLVLRATGRRVIYDVHEDVPAAILNRHWIPRPVRPWVARLAAGLENVAGRVFDGVIGATPHIAARFPEDKTATVQNYPLLETTSASETLAEEDPVDRVAFVGWISLERGIAEVIEAVRLVNQTHRLRLSLAGSYHRNIAERLETAAGWEYVDFLGWQSRSAVRRLLARSRMGIVTFLPIPNHVEAQPNKLFEYMSAGLPVIASDFPRWRDFVGDRGRLVDPQDPQQIAAAMRFYLDHPEEARAAGARGRRAVEQQYNWDVEAEQLLRVYQRVRAA